MAEPVTRIDTETTLDHEYSSNAGRICLTGVQALVCLPLTHRQRNQPDLL